MVDDGVKSNSLDFFPPPSFVALEFCKKWYLLSPSVVQKCRGRTGQILKISIEIGDFKKCFPLFLKDLFSHADFKKRRIFFHLSMHKQMLFPRVSQSQFCPFWHRERHTSGTGKGALSVTFPPAQGFQIFEWWRCFCDCFFGFYFALLGWWRRRTHLNLNLQRLDQKISFYSEKERSLKSPFGVFLFLEDIFKQKNWIVNNKRIESMGSINITYK